jgi:hypothetical protein
LLLDYKGDGEIKLNCDKPVRARQFHPGLSTHHGHVHHSPPKVPRCPAPP